MSIFKMAARLSKYPVILLILVTILITGCSTNQTSSIPPDFEFMMDVGRPETGSATNINIRINAQGEGRFEYYDTGGVIQYDLNDVITYKADQVLDSGKFKLSNAELNELWEAINDYRFFELTDDYRMALGSSYAFILLEADGRRHMVDNIGMEVPEIRELVEATDAIMPEGVDLYYGKGFVP